MSATVMGPANRSWAHLAPDVAELQGHRAGFVSRAIAFSIDWAVVVAGVPVIMWGIGIVQGLVNFEAPHYPDLPSWMPPVISGVWAFWYFVGLWFFTGRTVGGIVMGLRVVGREKPSVGIIAATVRFWVMVVTIFVVAEVWLILSKSRLAIHDRAAHTQVVYDSAQKRREVQVALAAEGQVDQAK